MIPSPNQSSLARVFAYTAYGTFVYAVCAGFRDNYGIMLPSLIRWSGLSYATLSFILALGQLFFGLMQPVFGALSLRTSSRVVLCTGSLMMLGGLLLIPAARSAWLLTLALGVLLPSGTAAASFGIIMGCVTPRVSPRQAHCASGIIASGIGLSICILAPLMQKLLAAHGLKGVIVCLSVVALLLIPVSLRLTSGSMASATAGNEGSAVRILCQAFHNAAYRRVALAFLTCGFHMALIQTHLFSQLTGTYGMAAHAASIALSVYGVGVIAGAVGSGMACTRFAMPRVLGWLYASRCVWAALLLMPVPQPLLFVVIFLLGLTGVATVAPTSGLIGHLFGPRRLALLFGFAYLLHQIGAFVSAWAGGLCLSFTGSYQGVWAMDIALCLAAGLACLGIPKNP